MDAPDAKLAAQIGSVVRTQRTRLGWSQATLAERLDSSVEYISLIERGERLPALTTLVRLAKILGVSAASLLGEEKQSTTERDPMQSLVGAIPDAARPAVIGMLHGVIQAYQKQRKRR